jgi:hypothetical protein
LGINSFAQKHTLSLQVKDGNNKKPLEFCNVVIFNNKDSIITKAFTNEKGYANIPLKSGKYKILLQMFGYKSDTIKNVIIRDDTFLDVYKLQPEDYEIKKITVKGQSRRVELDKDVQIITNEQKKGAANTYDVLDKVNGLHYDRYNNKITVDNDDNIIILVNGIEKNPDYIKNINPERLQKVEVIRDPGGKYGLKGYSAIINIVLRSDYKGLDLSASNFMILNYLHKDLPFYEFSFGNVNFNYTNRKINIYAEYSPSVSNFHVNSTKIQRWQDSSKTLFLNPENDIYNATFKNLNHNFDLGLDYYASPKNTFSTEINYSYSPLNLSRQGINQIVEHIINNNVVNSFQMQTLSQTGSKQLDASVFYIGKYNDKNNLNLSYTYSNFNSENNISLLYDTVNTLQYGQNNRIFSEFDAEYNYSFNKKIGFVLGYGNIFKKIDNTFYPNFSDQSIINKFSYKDFRNEAYSYLTFIPNKKIGVKFGIGLENALLSHDKFKKIFNIYEPYFDLKYNPLKFLSIKLKYRADGKYPTVNQLNPFTTVIDFQTIAKGNPDLKPEKYNKISLKFSIMHGLLSIEPYYEFSNNAIITTITRQNNLWLQTFDNAAISKEKGLKINFVAPFGKSIFMQNSFKFFNQAISYNNETHSNKDWSMNSQLIYRNPKSSTMFGLFYQKQLVKNINWQGYSHNGNDLWGLFFQQPLFKQKLNIMLIYSLPINWGMDFVQGSYSKTSMYEEYSYTDLSIIKNMIMFQITYRFSKGKRTKRLDKKINVEQETQTKRLF